MSRLGKIKIFRAKIEIKFIIKTLFVYLFNLRPNQCWEPAPK